MSKQLNNRQLAFIQEYPIDLCAAKAAIRAGYSPKTAGYNADKLLKNIKIKTALEIAIKNRSDRTEITSDRVLIEIARLAFNDPRKAFDDAGNLLPIQQWPDEVAATISSVKIRKESGNTGADLIEIKFWDKGKQIELAARHLGMLNDKIDLTGNVTIKATRNDENL